MWNCVNAVVLFFFNFQSCLRVLLYQVSCDSCLITVVSKHIQGEAGGNWCSLPYIVMHTNVLQNSPIYVNVYFCAVLVCIDLQCKILPF